MAHHPKDKRNSVSSVPCPILLFSAREASTGKHRGDTADLSQLRRTPNVCASPAKMLETYFTLKGKKVYFSCINNVLLNLYLGCYVKMTGGYT